MSEPGPISEISAAQTSALVADDAVLLLDVREDDEWQAGHADRAVHTPLGQVDAALVPRDRPIVVVCRSGHRSGLATGLLRAAGHDVRNLAGGMNAWAQAGLPVLRADGTAGEVI